MRLKRIIVVDDEKWRWSVRRNADYSEYTPAGTLYIVTLQGPDGYRRDFDGDDVAYGSEAITPGAVAEFIRKLRKENRWP